MAELLHGTAIAVDGRAALIRGPSGAGKSDLALRCLAVPVGPFAAAAPQLVADDQVEVIAEQGHLRIAAPDAIQGLIEVRGNGIVKIAFVEQADLVLVVDLVAPDAVERMPVERLTAKICGVELARILIAPFQSSAPLKLLLALADTGKFSGQAQPQPPN